jgi:hypothetical protein
VGFATETEQDRKKYGEPTLSLHRKIRDTVDKIVEKNRAPCVMVSSIRREVGKDPRTVRFHLKLLEAADYGSLSKDGKLFCPKKSEKKS